MRSALLLIGCLCVLSGWTQHRNVELVANVDLGEFTNDIWGYVDGNGIEYAIVGSRNATHVFSLEDPANPVKRTEIIGAGSTWRDMKHYGDYVYSIADQGRDGLLIIDMSKAPDEISHTFWAPELTVSEGTDILRRCHNLYIDTSTGLCFLSGCNLGSSGVIIFDLTADPTEPVMLGAADETYSHDVFARGDTLIASEIFDGQFSIYDISDRGNPVRLASVLTSTRFTHNAWLSDDGRYVFTTDERTNAFVDAYDISDLELIDRVDAFRPLATDGMCGLPHNTHYYDGYLVTSWYSDGVIITDASRPGNLIEVGNYDTFGGSQGAAGCWGAYPYLPSGLILASDQQSGLYVLRPNYVRACYLEGVITDMSSGLAINNVMVDIKSDDPNEGTSNALGSYKTGQVTPGRYTVVFEHPDYFPAEMEVELSNGVLTTVDIQMEKRPLFTVSGSVQRATDGASLADVHVVLKSTSNTFDTLTDATGSFSIDVGQDVYDVFFSQWGYETTVNKGVDVSSATSITPELQKGYQDDFVADLGWTITGDAQAGIWERAVPTAAFTLGILSNPDADYDGDSDDACYVTGNASACAVLGDVDHGITNLASPVMDLSTFQDPIVEYNTWFVNTGGSIGEPNDSLAIFMTNGTDTVLLETVKDTVHAGGFWRERSSISLSGLIDLSDNMQLIVHTGDITDNGGHVVDAGFDAFLVREGLPSSTSEILSEALSFHVFPNPFDDGFRISIPTDQFEVGTILRVYDIHGRLVDQRTLTQATQVLGKTYTPGMYFVQIVQDRTVSVAHRVVKQ